jgi:hypothetical protein
MLNCAMAAAEASRFRARRGGATEKFHDSRQSMSICGTAAEAVPNVTLSN